MAIVTKSAARNQFWQKHLQIWQKSGLSQAAYCRRAKLVIHRFIYWKNQLLKPVIPQSLVPVKPIAPGLPGHPDYELIISGTVRLRINGYFDPETLKRLIRVIREA